MKPVAITEQDAALWLARHPRKKRDSRIKVRSRVSSEEILADDFLRNFSVRALHIALQDNGKPLDISWYVKNLLVILRSAELQKDRLAVLDRIKDLILLGAIQDPALSEEMMSRLPGTSKSPVNPIEDPFVGQPLKLRRKEA